MNYRRNDNKSTRRSDKRVQSRSAQVFPIHTSQLPSLLHPAHSDLQPHAGVRSGGAETLLWRGYDHFQRHAHLHTPSWAKYSSSPHTRHERENGRFLTNPCKKKGESSCGCWLSREMEEKRVRTGESGFWWQVLTAHCRHTQRILQQSSYVWQLKVELPIVVQPALTHSIAHSRSSTGFPLPPSRSLSLSPPCDLRVNELMCYEHRLASLPLSLSLSRILAHAWGMQTTFLTQPANMQPP